MALPGSCETRVDQLERLERSNASAHIVVGRRAAEKIPRIGSIRSGMDSDGVSADREGRRVRAAAMASGEVSGRVMTKSTAASPAACVRRLSVAAAATLRSCRVVALSLEGHRADLFDPFVFGEAPDADVTAPQVAVLVPVQAA